MGVIIMALKTLVNQMHKYIDCIKKDLQKAEKGNKAASQRVRTCSIKLEKIAKKYRKESVACVKKCAKKTTCKKAACKKKTTPVKKRKPVKKTTPKRTTKKKTKR